MKITKDYTKRVTRNLLDFFNKENVTTTSDLERLTNHKFRLDDKEAISVESRPSNSGTKARTISYIAVGSGIPLEIKINEELGYSALIINGDFTAPEYMPFSIDVFGNIVGYKKLNSTDISQVKLELGKLLELSE